MFIWVLHTYKHAVVDDPLKCFKRRHEVMSLWPDVRLSVYASLYDLYNSHTRILACIRCTKPISGRLVLNFNLGSVLRAGIDTSPVNKSLTISANTALSRDFGLRHIAPVTCQVCPYIMLMDHSPGKLHIVGTK